MVLVNINKKLAYKFYLFSIGLYAAIASVFLFLYLFQIAFCFNQLTSIFIGYFITVFWRSFYDQLIIYKLTIKQIYIRNNFILALIAAVILSTFYYFIKSLLGDWAIPVTVIISMKIIGEIKKIIWPNSSSRLPEFFQIYMQKIQDYSYGLYGFLISIALITYLVVKLFGISYFYLALTLGMLFSLISEQLYELIVVYRIKLTKFLVFITIVIAIISSILCSILIFILMQEIGFSGKIATIFSIIILKLIQPLIFNQLIKT